MKTVFLIFILSTQVIAQKDLRKDHNSCAVWGSKHYHTFDGKGFEYPGQCTYALAIDCRPGEDDFAVHVENGIDCAGSDVHSCKKAVVIYINDEPYRINHDSKVTKNANSIKLPFADSDVLISEHAEYVYFDAWNGKLVVKYDGKDSIYVQVSDEYKNGTCGLCGNNNGDQKDDLQLPNEGGLTSSVVEFGNSWAKPDFGQKCENVKATTLSECAKISELSQLMSEMKCKAIKRITEFAACNAVLDPEPYYQKCLEEVCKCGTGPACECGTLEQYSRECTRHGLKMNWRTADLCPVNCTNNKVFMECGPSCTLTCSSKGATSICKDGCIDGCHCPAGTSLSNGVCIPKEECPCQHNGEEYKHGVTIKMANCKQCVCNGGQWKCNTTECEGHTYLYGHGHYKTFDGKTFNYENKCPNTLVTSNDKVFSVMADRKSCDGKDCFMVVMVAYKSNHIRLSYSNGEFRVTKNNANTKLPVISDRGFKLMMTSSIFIKFEAIEGFHVLWDGKTRLYVKVPILYKDKVVGLAGNYNGKTIDDFSTPSGDLSHSEIDFGNSWLIADQNCSKLANDYKLTACEENHQNALVADKKCSILTGDTFKVCHSVIDPSPYFVNCKEDVCGCGNDGKECLCSVLSAYARECALSGREVDGWRAASGCDVTCPADQKYTECGSSCTKSCGDVLSPNVACEEECVEGCMCPKDLVLDSLTGKCVTKVQCGCTYGNKTIANGKKVHKDCNTCMCHQGTLQCTNYDCSANKTDTSCFGGKIFSNCAPKCTETCHSSAGQTCPAENGDCEAGCVCPLGLVEYNGTCINQTSCPCYHNGKEYGERTTITKGCNTCQCQRGKWSCTQKDCPGTCSVFGDPHYKTFDGKIFDYQGRCNHVMVSDFCANSAATKETIRVEANTMSCGSQDVTCAKEIRASIHGTTFILKKGAKKAEIIPSNVTDDEDHYRVFEFSGSYVHIVTAYGVSLLWDNGTRLYVTVQPEHAGKLCGLCGNFDGNEANDFVTFQGDTTGSSLIFGDSWRSQDSCPLAKEVINTCKARPHRLDPSKKECSVIKSDKFKACHNLVNPIPYYDRCVFDVCGCDKIGDCDCVCDAVAAYQKECQDEGVFIEWRKGHHMCEKEMCCPTNMTYVTKGSSCPPTCKYPYGDPYCPTKYVEGCQCPKGKVQDIDSQGNVRCVHPSKCQVCRVDGRIYTEGEKVIRNCKECVCHKGQMQCTGQECPTTTQPPTTTTQSTTTPSTTPSTTTESTTTTSTTTPTTATTSTTTTTTTAKPKRYCVYNNGTHNVTLPVGEQVYVDECTNRKCIIDNVTGSTEIELLVQTCNDDSCETGCEILRSRRSILVKVPGKCCKKCVTPDDACADPGFLPCGGNGKTTCVPKEWFCDGRPDCSNGRDEECCPTIPPTTTTPTTTTIFTTTTSTTTTTKPCIPPKVPTSCAPMCEEKCHYLGKCDTVFGMANMCVAGCKCSNGTVWNGTTCITPEGCPCKDEYGNIHSPESIWVNPKDKCADCKCFSNQIKCSKRKCPPLMCPIDQQELRNGSCCRTCRAITTTMPPTTTSTTQMTTTTAQTTITGVCDCKYLVPFGVEDGRISDKNLRSKSVKVTTPGNSYTGPEQARLNNEPSSTGSGAWEPNDSEGSLYVYFNKVEEIKEIRTQGSPSSEKFTHKFFLFYSKDGINFESDPVLSPEGSYLFDGNTDSRNVKINKLEFSAKAVQIVPVNDVSHGDPEAALRVEFYGCPPCGYTTPIPTTTTTQSPSTTTESTTSTSTTPSTTTGSTTSTSTTPSTTTESTTSTSTTPSTTTESTTSTSTTPSTTTGSTTSTSTTPSTTTESTTSTSTTPSTTTESTTSTSTSPSTTTESTTSTSTSPSTTTESTTATSTTPSTTTTTTSTSTTMSTNIYTVTPPQTSTEKQERSTSTSTTTTSTNPSTTTKSTTSTSTTPSTTTKSTTPTTTAPSTTTESTTSTSTTPSTTTESTTSTTTAPSSSPKKTGTTGKVTESTTDTTATTKPTFTTKSTTGKFTFPTFTTPGSTSSSTKTTKSSTTSKKCDCTEVIPVGVSDNRIPDKNLRSNSVKVTTPGKSYTGPGQARLNNQPSSTGSGAWEPKDSEGSLYVYFNKLENIKEIRTQGSPSSEKYTRRYFLFYSKDGVTFSAPIMSESGMIFEGNTDNTNTKVHKLNVGAKAIRIQPVNDVSLGDPEPALRVEFYVCPPCEKTTLPPSTSTTTESSTTQSITTESTTSTSTTPSTTSTSTTPSTTSTSTTPSKTTESTTSTSTTPSTTTESTTSTITTPSTTSTSTTPSTTTELTTSTSTTPSTTTESTTSTSTTPLTTTESTTSTSTTPSTTTESTTSTSTTPSTTSTSTTPSTTTESTTTATTIPSTTTESTTTTTSTTPSTTTTSTTTNTTPTISTNIYTVTPPETTTEKQEKTTTTESTTSTSTSPSTTKSTSTTESTTTESSTLTSTTPLTTLTSTSPSTTTESTTLTSTTPSTTTESTTSTKTTPSTTTPSTTSTSTSPSTTTKSTTSTTARTTTKSRCDCSKLHPVGVSDGQIPDRHMRSSSVKVTTPGKFYTGPEQARLNNKPSSNGSGAWEPKHNEGYIEIIFNKVETVKEIKTQGSPSDGKYTRRYFLYYSKDGVNYEQEPVVSSNGEMLFEGNTDASSTNTQKLHIIAKSVKIWPTNDESLGDPEAALRVEFFACPPCESTTLPPSTTTTSTTTPSTTIESTTSTSTTSPTTTESTTSTSTTPSTTESTTSTSTTPSTTIASTTTTTTSTTPSTTTTSSSTTPTISTNIYTVTPPKTTTEKQEKTTTESTTSTTTTPSTTISTTSTSTTPPTTTESTTSTSTTPSTTTEPTTSTSTTPSTTTGSTTSTSTTPSTTTESSTTTSTTPSTTISTTSTSTTPPTTTESTTSTSTTPSTTTEPTTSTSTTPSTTTGSTTSTSTTPSTTTESTTSTSITPPITTESTTSTSTTPSTTTKSTTSTSTTPSTTTESTTSTSTESTTSTSTTPSTTTESTTSSSTTPSTTTESSTTTSTTPSTTTELTTSTSTTLSTTSTTTVTTTSACPSEQVYSKNCSYEFHCDSRILCQPSQYTGCCCPHGLYKVGDRCVEKKDCPCISDGEMKSEGSVWRANQYELCRCKDGKQECTKSCPESLQCAEHQKKIFGERREDGSCCKCVQNCQYCKTEKHKYVQVGTTWWVSRDENKCVQGKCILDDDEECAQVEKDVTICEKSCGPNMKRASNDTNCCQCVCDYDSCHVKSPENCSQGQEYVKDTEACCGYCKYVTTTTTTTTESTTSTSTTPSTTTESTTSTSTTPSTTTEITTSTSTTPSTTTESTTSTSTTPSTTTESTTSTSTTPSTTTESTTTSSTTPSTTTESTTSTRTTPSTTTESTTTASTTPSSTTESTTSTSTTPSTTTEESTTTTSTTPSTTTESTTTSTTTTSTSTTPTISTNIYTVTPPKTTTEKQEKTTTTKSTTTRKKCDCTELVPVGVSDNRIPDKNLRSSSVKVTTPGSSYTGPEQARLNNQPSSTGSGAWEPKDSEGSLYVYFNKLENIKEIRTQGSPSSKKYTRRYFLFDSTDGVTFSAPVMSENGMIFEGNTDNSTAKVHKLNVAAKAIRIQPVNDVSLGDPEPALRVEFYVCPPCENTTLPPSTTTTSTTTPSTTIESTTSTSTTSPTTTESTTSTSTTPSTTTESTTITSTTPSTTTEPTTSTSTTPSTTTESTTSTRTTPSTTTESTTTTSTTPSSTTESTTSTSTTPSTTTEESTTTTSTTPSTTTESTTSTSPTPSTTTESTTTSTTTTSTSTTPTISTNIYTVTPPKTTTEKQEKTTTTKSTTTRKTCDCTELVPVGVSDNRIPDKNLRSSSVKVTTPGSSYTGPEQARLNNQPSSTGSGAWEPKDSEGSLYVYFNKLENIKEIRTQGSPSSKKYTRRYFLFDSTDGVTFSAPVMSENGMIFEGNTDNSNAKVHKLNVAAKAIRIQPVNDVSLGDPEPALRVEFYVCPPCENATLPPSTTTTSTTTPSTTIESTTSTSTTSPTTTESTTSTSTTPSITTESTTSTSTTPSTTTESKTSTTSTPSTTTESTTSTSTTPSTTTESTTTTSTTPSTTTTSSTTTTTTSTIQSTEIYTEGPKTTPTEYQKLNTTTKTTTREPSPCKVEYTMTKVKQNFCYSKEDVQVASCSGSCESKAVFSMENPYYKQECSCCKPVEFEDVEVPMTCLRKRASSVTIKRIKYCVCNPCNDKEVIPSVHPTSDDSVNPDEISNEPIVSRGERKRRSLTDFLYDLFTGGSN